MSERKCESERVRERERVCEKYDLDSIFEVEFERLRLADFKRNPQFHSCEAGYLHTIHFLP